MISWIPLAYLNVWQQRNAWEQPKTTNHAPVSPPTQIVGAADALALMPPFANHLSTLLHSEIHTEII